MESDTKKRKSSCVSVKKSADPKSPYASAKKAVDPEKILANDLIATATTMAATILCQRDDSLKHDITKVFERYSIHILETGQLITTKALRYGCRAIHPRRICAISNDPEEYSESLKHKKHANWYCQDWDEHISSCPKLVMHPSILLWLDACCTLDKLEDSIKVTIAKGNLAPVAVLGITFCEHYKTNATRNARVAELDKQVIAEGKKVGKTIERVCTLVYGHHTMVLVIYMAYDDRGAITGKVGEKRALANVVKLQELCNIKTRLLEMVADARPSAGDQRPAKRLKRDCVSLALHIVGTLDTIHLNVQTDKDINYIKEYLGRMGCKVVNIQYRGKVLEDKWSLDMCGIEDDDIVEVYV